MGIEPIDWANLRAGASGQPRVDPWAASRKMIRELCSAVAFATRCD